ncbi:hypothetical protein LCGC14_2110650 [marine sediment metagenome]|uniref:Uncharacterized protein n=1 Tax=marine sediment metagenome TaxID=412755 RepID=A0A0F9H3M4_9ZZZZ
MTRKTTKKPGVKPRAPKQKKVEEQQQEQAPSFEQMVDGVLLQLRETTIRSYARKNSGAFKFGVAGLKVLATELLDQATEYQGFFSAASFSLAAALLSIGAYNLKQDPQYMENEEKKRKLLEKVKKTDVKKGAKK